MARNLVNRYVWLVDTINRYGRITLNEIMEAWLRSDISEGKPLPGDVRHQHRVRQVHI